MIIAICKNKMDTYQRERKAKGERQHSSSSHELHKQWYFIWIHSGSDLI